VTEGWGDEKRKKIVGVNQSQGVSPDRKQKKRQHLEQTEGGYRQTRAVTASTARAGTDDVGGGIVGDGDKDDGGAGGAGGGSGGGGVDDDGMSGDDGDDLGGADGGGDSKGGSDVDGMDYGLQRMCRAEPGGRRK